MHIRFAVPTGAGVAAVAALLSATSAHAACTDNLSADRELNIRSGPSTSNRPVGRIPGQACNIRVAQCDDGWCRVSYNGMRGYSSEFYLDTEGRNQSADGRDQRRPLQRWANIAERIFSRLSRDPDWERVGEFRVGRRQNRSIIQLDRTDGRFDALRFRVRTQPVDFERVVVVYGNGQRDNLNFNRTVNDGEESGEIDLRGRNGRFIDRIIFVHQKERPRGRPAEVEVWAHKTSSGRNVAGRRGNNNVGPRWTDLATLEVDRRRDRDVVDLDRRDGRFDALRLKAFRNDVRIRRVRVVYGNGRTEDLDVDWRLRQGETTDVMQLAGRRGRFIDRIVLVYGTQGRGPTARVRVWGRESQRS